MNHRSTAPTPGSPLKVLITGATGFIGGHLAPALSRAGHEVHALVRPASAASSGAGLGQVHRMALTEGEPLRLLLEQIRPDVLIHLASLTRPGMDPADFDDHYEHTVRPALNLARLAPASVQLALFFGSSIEYGNQPPPFFETTPPQCCSPYAWGKIAAFHGVTEILALRQVPWCWARPFLTYGPGPMRSQLIPALIRGCLAGERIPLTEGAQSRDFIYIDDLCDMVLRLIEGRARAAGEVINLASGIPRTIRAVAEQVRDQVGRGELVFGALPYRAHEALHFHGSTAKFEALFGPTPLTPFEQGIAATVEAYRR